MGVQGLYTFLLQGDFLTAISFRESKLIIDGANFFNIVYSTSQLDQAHGGDYEAFEDLVTEFIRNLRLCQIEPYVIFDGGNDVNDKKFNTLIERSQQRIQEAYKLSRGQTASVRLPLTEEVFMQVLRKLNVPFIQCLFEADWELAALAKEWDCPILSNDSDFFIFGNKGGVIPITLFEWKKLNMVRGTNKQYISAKLFVVEKLCSAYKNLNKDHLPLFANILGNDYININHKMLPNWVQFATKSGKAAKIDGLLRWLSRYPSPREAITALTKSERIHQELYEGMEAYCLKPSSISQFFKSGEPQSRPPGPLQKLPNWILKPLAEGRLNSTVINILMLQRNRLNSQVEDFDLSSSNETSKYIRQVTYGILLCTRRPGDIGHGTSSTEVEEYDRQGLTLVKSKIQAVLPKCAETHLFLDMLWETPHSLRLKVLLDALSVSPLPDLQIPQNLQLAVYITCFWLKNAQPKPKVEMFQALLIGLVYGELLEEKEAGTLITRLKHLKDCESKMKRVDLSLAHAYSQWQKCLRHGYELNQLLNNPVPEPKLARLYSGPLLHSVARELMKGCKPESLLTEASVAIELYHNLQATMKREFSEEDELSKMFKHLRTND